VWGRTATFLLLLIAFLRAPPAVSQAPDPDELAHMAVPAD
jgi:hypothetical protein